MWCSACRRLEPYGYIVYSLCCNFFVCVCDECTRLSVRDSAIAVATLLLVAFRLDVVVVVDSKNPSIATCHGSFCLRFVFEQF